MKKSFFRQICNWEYALSSIVVMALVWLMGVISGLLPDADRTSFLNPIFDRIDFLNIEDVSLDAIFAVKPSGFPDERIVIVNVGEVAPTPDGKIAAAVERIHNYGSRAIGIDVIFDDLHFERFPEERLSEKDALIQAFRDADNVVLVNGYDTETLLPAFEIDPAIRSAAHHYGYASLEKDDDGVVRRFLPYRTIDGERWLSFPIRILEQFDSSLIAPLMALPEEPQIIYYTATHNQFQGQTLPIDDVIEHPDALAPFYRKIFNGAIVLIGFVNEGGLWYPEDTHKTPMGKKITVEQRDGSARMGMEGPDMSGLLIHANVINMMLHHDFIRPISRWGDWLLVFFLSYISIAVYRVLRTKPVSRIAIGTLITGLLAVESLVVFFLPIIAFFNMDIKISYDLMATAVLLFIPANAMVNKVRVTARHLYGIQRAKQSTYPPLTVFADAFKDDESFPLYVRIVHASLYAIHFVFAVRCVSEKSAGCLMPSRPVVDDWKTGIPEIGTVFQAGNRKDMAQTYFYQYLDGMKDRYLRDSYVKEQFFQTEFSKYNPHHYYEEWEILQPHVRRMMNRDLRKYQDWRVRLVAQEVQGTSRDVSSVEQAAGSRFDVMAYKEDQPEKLINLSPFCIYAECKLHRRKELFVFAADIPKQFDADSIPVYYGETVACEAVLPPGVLHELKTRLIHTQQPLNA